MPDLTVSAFIDSLMGAASALAARNTLGTKQNLSLTAANETEFAAAIAAIEADPSYNTGTIYITASFSITSTVGTILTKDYTIVGTGPSALSGLRPLLSKGNGAWLTMNGKRLILSNLRMTFAGPQVMFTMGADTYMTAFGCDFEATAGGQIFKREYQGALAAEFVSCKTTMTNGTFIYCGAGNPANGNNPAFEVSFVGCDLSGFLFNVENGGKGRVSLVNTTLVDLGSGCWKATEASAGRTDFLVHYNGTIQVSLALAAGSTEPITFHNTARTFVKMDVFAASGTWTKPTWATEVEVIAIGPGGGGGSGRRGAAGTARYSGGGGGGGAHSRVTFRAADLGATEAVTIGTPGAGGAAATVDDTNGNAGVNGGPCTFGAKVRAAGGVPGGGGTASAGGGQVGASPFGCASTSQAVLSGGTGNQGSLGGGGGGAGGGLDSSNTERNGGAGNACTAVNAAASSAGTTASPDAPTASAHGIPYTPGCGGGGGASKVGQRAGNGATALDYGGGGGGGGASENGFDSGRGGDGAPGVVIVISRG